MSQQGGKPIVDVTSKVWNQLQSVHEVLRTRRAGETNERINVRGRLLRVLIVDDNLDTTDSLSVLVNMWGHDARTAPDGESALEVASAYQPDVLLLDMGMPKMDGCRLAQRLRRQPQFKDAQLIAITGYADEAHRLLAERAGFDVYLVKPVAPQTIERILQLEQRRLPQRDPVRGGEPIRREEFPAPASSADSCASGRKRQR